MDSAADEWELWNDDGFIYKRGKRRPDDPPAVEGPDPEPEERLRREQKRKALKKLEKQYRKEIAQWEYLSNIFRAMQDKAQQRRPQDSGETTPLLGSASKLVQENETGCGLLADELLLQAEVEEAISQYMSSVCDVAEAMCNSQEEKLKQSFYNLPVWSSSPHELMALLCE